MPSGDHRAHDPQPLVTNALSGSWPQDVVHAIRVPLVPHAWRTGAASTPQRTVQAEKFFSVFQLGVPGTEPTDSKQCVYLLPITFHSAQRRAAHTSLDALRRRRGGCTDVDAPAALYVPRQFVLMLATAKLWKLLLIRRAAEAHEAHERELALRVFSGFSALKRFTASLRQSTLGSIAQRGTSPDAPSQPAALRWRAATARASGAAAAGAAAPQPVSAPASPWRRLPGLMTRAADTPGAPDGAPDQPVSERSNAVHEPLMEVSHGARAWAQSSSAARMRRGGQARNGLAALLCRAARAVWPVARRPQSGSRWGHVSAAGGPATSDSGCSSAAACSSGRSTWLRDASGDGAVVLVGTASGAEVGDRGPELERVSSASWQEHSSVGGFSGDGGAGGTCALWRAVCQEAVSALPRAGSDRDGSLAVAEGFEPALRAKLAGGVSSRAGTAAMAALPLAPPTSALDLERLQLQELQALQAAIAARMQGMLLAAAVARTPDTVSATLATRANTAALNTPASQPMQSDDRPSSILTATAALDTHELQPTACLDHPLSSGNSPEHARGTPATVTSSSGFATSDAPTTGQPGASCHVEQQATACIRIPCLRGTWTPGCLIWQLWV
jgi:hypothetical protein